MNSLHDLAMNKGRWTPIDELRCHVGTLGAYLRPPNRGGHFVIFRRLKAMAKANQFVGANFTAIKAVEAAVKYYHDQREGRGKKSRR